MPGGHWQVKLPIVSKQSCPDRQGSAKHSFTFTQSVAPDKAYPALHEHSKPVVAMYGLVSVKVIFLKLNSIFISFHVILDHK